MTRSKVAKHVVVYTTTPSAEIASKISSAIVTEKLAACVQTLPGVTSTYWWDGKVNTDQEHLLIIKTRSDLVSQLDSIISNLHPYDTPELVATPITDGAKKYLDWIDSSTKK